MCGIAGLIAGPDVINRATVVGALEDLEHRGPDDRGILLFDGEEVSLGTNWDRGPSGRGVALCHTRLSIIDLSRSGWQPMSTPDGRYHLVFNGEIYNYLELREKLEGLGHRFQSDSDSEVLLLAYAEWGRVALTRLIGMFAFAVLDTEARTVFLARDFFGIKPLFYSRRGRDWAFASELAPLLRLPWIDRTVDPEALHEYLRFGQAGFGDRSMFAGIRQLPAGHFLEIGLDDAGPPNPTCYWHPELNPALDISRDEAVARMRELFLESVRLHLRSDVPLGAALSGGIDSSAIVASMREVAGTDLEIHAFSYIAQGTDFSEERWIDIAGEAAGARIHKVYPESGDLAADLDALIRTQGEPFASTSIFAQNRVFRAAREAGVTVMLDGQGADELLAGYLPHVAARLASQVRSADLMGAARLIRGARPTVASGRLVAQATGFLLPQRISARLRGRGWPRLGVQAPYLDLDWFRERGVDTVAADDPYSSRVLHDHMSRTLTRTSLPALLRYEDRNSMAYSIESRVPFLTPAMAELVFSLPEAFLVSDRGVTKSVFRDAMQGIVPDPILDRRDKIGFFTPGGRWLRSLDPWVSDIFGSDTLEEIPPLRTGFVRETWADFAAGDAPFGRQVWRWLNLVKWAQVFDVEFS